MGNTTNYHYENGNLKTETDRNENTITYDYDALDRIKTKTETKPDGTVDKIFNYDYSLTGNKILMSEGTEETRCYYDDLGRLIKQTESNQIEKQYDYDANNNRKTFTIKQNGITQQNTTYTYDKINRMEKVYEDSELTATYTYDANGNRQTLTYTNGNTVDYTYNLANRLTDLTNKNGQTVISQYTYTYYLDGNRAKKTDNQTNVTTEYIYDGLGRLKSETEKQNEQTITKREYSYDDNNNRQSLTKTQGETITTIYYNYDANNRLTTETETTGDITNITNYNYDKNGNQLSKYKETIQPEIQGSKPEYKIYLQEEIPESYLETYEYDTLNRLTKTIIGQTTVEYTYNPEGLRTSKTVNGNKTTHIWDGQNIVLEIDTLGNITNKYIRGINLISAEDIAGTKTYYLFNGHGDVVQLTQADGTVTKTYEYDAFGNEKNIDPNDTNVFRYCSEYFDKETGTIYLRARYYDPSIGRFISEDSYLGDVNDPLSLNLYTYCGNNPIIFIDPSGHEPWTYLGEDNKYHFLPDFKANNIANAIYGYIPFLDKGVQKLTDWMCGTQTIVSSDIKSVASNVITALSLADKTKHIKTASKTGIVIKGVGRVVGKYAGFISNIITGVNVGKEMLSESTYINEITSEIFGTSLTSDSRETLIAKYLIYSSFVRTLVDNKIVTYSTSWGTLEDINIDWDKFSEMKKELKIDETIENIINNSK